jgi:hypothetical protein
MIFVTKEIKKSEKSACKILADAALAGIIRTAYWAKGRRVVG